jgi:hypothetical protein
MGILYSITSSRVGLGWVTESTAVRKGPPARVSATPPSRRVLYQLYVHSTAGKALASRGAEPKTHRPPRLDGKARRARTQGGLVAAATCPQLSAAQDRVPPSTELQDVAQQAQLAQERSSYAAAACDQRWRKTWATSMCACGVGRERYARRHSPRACPRAPPSAVCAV